mgnify:CR=1 FL=1
MTDTPAPTKTSLALATGAVPAAGDQLRWMAVQAVQQAILAVGTDSAHR